MSKNRRIFQSCIIFAFLSFLILGTKLSDKDYVDLPVEKLFDTPLAGVCSEIIQPKTEELVIAPFAGVCNAIILPDASIEQNEVDKVSKMPLEALNLPQIELLDYSTTEYTFENYILSMDEIRAIAQMVIAEAENQPELGQRLVCDVILNRLVSNRWNYNSIISVLTAEGQFMSYWNGRFDAVGNLVTDETIILVIEELNSRTNTEVIYFNTGGYNGYAPPICQVADHYFCGQQ